MTLDEAIKELEERASWKRDAAEMAEDDNGIGNEVALAEAAEDEQLAEWLRELKEAKRLLRLAVKDITFILSYTCSDDEMCCQECPTENHACNKWRYTDEAEKLLKEADNG